MHRNMCNTENVARSLGMFFSAFCNFSDNGEATRCIFLPSK